MRRIYRTLFALVLYIFLGVKVTSGQVADVAWRYLPTGLYGPAQISMSPNGRYTIAAFPTGESSPVDVLLLENGEVVMRFSGQVSGWGQSVGVSDNGDFVVRTSTGIGKGQYNDIFVFDRSGTRTMNARLSGLGWFAGVAISPDGEYIAVAGGDKVWLYDQRGTRLWQRIVQGNSNLKHVNISKGASVLVADDGDSIAFRFDQKGNLVSSFKTSFPGSRLSPSGSILALAQTIPNTNSEKVAIAIYHLIDGRSMHWVGRPEGLFEELLNWEILDFSVSDNGAVAMVLDMSKNVIDGSGVGIRLFSQDGIRVAEEEELFYYSLSKPSGEVRATLPCVFLSNDGNLMVVSTGVEIRALINTELGKQW